MNTNISESMLSSFSTAFAAERANQVAQKAVVKSGLSAAAENQKEAIDNLMIFSLELETGDVTDQKSSGRCWLFAGLNTLRFEIMKKLNLKTFELSQNYQMFWDKLEKSNYFLESILDTLDEPTDGRLIQHLIASPVQDGGQWDMFCALVIALVDILFPVVTRKVLYDYIPNQAMRTFLIVMGAMLAAFLIRTAAQWIVTYLGHLMGVHIEADMRTAIFAHMQKLGFSFYDKNRTGLLMSRVTTDLFDITELAHHGPEDLFISIVTLTGSFLVLWNIQKKLALVLMIAVPMIVLFVAMRRRNMMKVSRDVKRRTAGINAEIESSISGVRVAKAFGNEDEEIDKFTRCTDQYVSAKQGYYKVMAGFFSGTELMMNLMSLSVIFVGSYLIMKNQMDIATLVTFNMYVASVQSPIRKLTQFTEQFTQGMAGFQRFRAIMHEDPDIVDAPDAVALTHVDGDIRFNDVSFSYDEGKGDVLSHINLHIKPGEMLALVGQSGGGKSTLCQLIPRFYEISSGSITLDGQDIRHIKLADLRGSIGIVQQDVFLFAGTIYDNIRYGRLDATDAEVVAAAKAAHPDSEFL